MSKEDLIISKLHWARKSHSERHLRDVKDLIATGCDTIYIERWIRTSECSSCHGNVCIPGPDFRPER